MDPYDKAFTLAELFEELEQMELQLAEHDDGDEVIGIGAVSKQYSDDLRPICDYHACPETVQ